MNTTSKREHPSSDSKKIVICGSSCSGKTTLKNALIDRGLYGGISTTTRRPRSSEIEGIDYRFVTEEAFERMIEEEFFFEFQKFNDNMYGTSMMDFELGDVFILTPSAIESMQPSVRKRCIVVFVFAPESVLTNRALQRGDDPKDIEFRSLRDFKEFNGFLDWDISFDSFEEDTEHFINRLLNFKWKTEKPA